MTTRPRSAALVLACLGALVLSSGCVLLEVGRQQKKIAAYCRISGTLETEHASDSPLIVGLVRLPESTDGEPKLADHFVLERAGRWFFIASPGRFGLAGFEDRNRNLVWDLDESALPMDEHAPLACGVGETIRDVELVIPKRGRLRSQVPIELAELKARSIVEQEGLTLGALMLAGEVTDLKDPRFARANADMGMWKPLDFTISVHPGIYFLERYDPDKTPVLFVHGMVGTPIDFEALIAKLDRSRFQPWVAYYPTGSDLDRVVDATAGLLAELRLRHRFERLFVVAHSMGGLVARGLILRDYDATGREDIALFVSISSPWGGVDSAAEGIKRSPAVVRSWYAIAPESAYLRGLFFEDPETTLERRRLPPHLAHHLLFGFRKEGRGLGASSDTTIVMSSQLFVEAQRDATRIYGFDETHTGILRSAEVSKLLNEILAEADD